MIQLTLNVTAAQMAAIAAIMGGEAAEPAKTTPRTRVKTEEPPAETGKGAEVKGKDAAGEDVDEAPSADNVAAAAKTLAAKNGRDALVEMLGQYGAKQLSGIAEGDRAQFIEDCEKAVG
jgi:hypothetical protein